MTQDTGASALPTGLAGAEAPEPPSRLGPSDGIPSAEDLFAIADRVERVGHEWAVPADLSREIRRERRTQMLCRAMCEHEGFDPDEIIDPIGPVLRWRDYESYLRIVDYTNIPRMTPTEMVEAIRLKAIARAIEAGTATTAETGVVHESAVGAADLHKGS